MMMIDVFVANGKETKSAPLAGVWPLAPGPNITSTVFLPVSQFSTSLDILKETVLFIYRNIYWGVL